MIQSGRCELQRPLFKPSKWRGLQTKHSSNQASRNPKTLCVIVAVVSVGCHFESMWQPAAIAATFYSKLAAVAVGCEFDSKWPPALFWHIALRDHLV